MKVEETFFETNHRDFVFVIVCLCDDKKRTPVCLTVDKLPHKKPGNSLKERRRWRKIEDALTDDRRVGYFFLGKTPQRIRKIFPEMRMSYRKLRSLMRRQEENE